jgi:cytochrome c oxidase subunit 1
VGLGPAANSAFAISTMAIAVPTGIKIFNWVGTVWGGSVRLATAMLFAVSFIALFTIGGLSGVMHAAVPSDAQQQDTYFVVAHFHYVLFGGAIIAIFGGIYYWWPKMTGWLLDERLGKLNWFLVFVGMNLTFFPMHWIGLDGMPRRIYTYDSTMGWNGSNLVITIGAFILAAGILTFIINFFYSRNRRVLAGDDPWDGRTLEWSIPSPPPHYNFEQIPEVEYRDDFWFRKYPELVDEYHAHVPGMAEPVGSRMDGDDDDEGSRTISPPSGGQDHVEHSGTEEGHGIHMPDMSYYPIILAAGVALAAAGLMTAYWVIAVGVLLIAWGIYGWSLEPVSEPESGEQAH